MAIFTLLECYICEKCGCTLLSTRVEKSIEVMSVDNSKY